MLSVLQALSYSVRIYRTLQKTLENKTRDAFTAMDLASWVLSIVWLDEFPNLILFFLKTDSWIAKPLNSETFDTDPDLKYMA